MKKIAGIVGAVLLLSLLSCASSGTTVNRVDASKQTDLSGYWNDTDVKIVCESLINDCLNSPRVDQAIKARGGKTPVVLVGSFRNESSEHIDTGIISSVMEVAIFNSGKMDFVAGGNTRNELRAERQDQQSNASEDTAAALAKETGADFMMFGSVKTIVDKAGNQTVRTYFITAEMTNVETNQRMWMGQNSEIKKEIVQAKNKL
ncbi:MAG: penicillin-binding protein activator LpoB [Treponema sp.]|nr:penicillin-binding protein activator LpoB [Treponema sp.]